MYGDLKILTGTANPQLAMDICDHLGCSLTPALCTTFSNGELRVEIGASVRGHDEFVIQPTCAPANKSLMELCLILDALKRASAGRITAVIPYFGYARQDRKVSPRAPISAKLVSDFLTVAGAQRIVTVDLHAGQIQGFFNCPVDNLYARPVLLKKLRKDGVPESRLEDLFALKAAERFGIEACEPLLPSRIDWRIRHSRLEYPVRPF